MIYVKFAIFQKFWLVLKQLQSVLKTLGDFGVLCFLPGKLDLVNSIISSFFSPYLNTLLLN